MINSRDNLVADTSTSDSNPNTVPSSHLIASSSSNQHSATGLSQSTTQRASSLPIHLRLSGSKESKIFVNPSTGILIDPEEVEVCNFSRVDKLPAMDNCGQQAVLARNIQLKNGNVMNRGEWEAMISLGAEGSYFSSVRSSSEPGPSNGPYLAYYPIVQASPPPKSQSKVQMTTGTPPQPPPPLSQPQSSPTFPSAHCLTTSVFSSSNSRKSQSSSASLSSSSSSPSSIPPPPKPPPPPPVEAAVASTVSSETKKEVKKEKRGRKIKWILPTDPIVDLLGPSTRYTVDTRERDSGLPIQVACKSDESNGCISMSNTTIDRKKKRKSIEVERQESPVTKKIRRKEMPPPPLPVSNNIYSPLSSKSDDDNQSQISSSVSTSSSQDTNLSSYINPPNQFHSQVEPLPLPPHSYAISQNFSNNQVYQEYLDYSAYQFQRNAYNMASHDTQSIPTSFTPTNLVYSQQHPAAPLQNHSSAQAPFQFFSTPTNGSNNQFSNVSTGHVSLGYASNSVNNFPSQDLSVTQSSNDVVGLPTTSSMSINYSNPVDSQSQFNCSDVSVHRTTSNYPAQSQISPTQLPHQQYTTITQTSQPSQNQIHSTTTYPLTEAPALDVAHASSQAHASTIEISPAYSIGIQSSNFVYNPLPAVSYTHDSSVILMPPPLAASTGHYSTSYSLELGQTQAPYQTVPFPSSLSTERLSPPQPSGGSSISSVAYGFRKDHVAPQLGLYAQEYHQQASSQNLQQAEIQENNLPQAVPIIHPAMTYPPIVSPGQLPSQASTQPQSQPQPQEVSSQSPAPASSFQESPMASIPSQLLDSLVGGALNMMTEAESGFEDVLKRHHLGEILSSNRFGMTLTNTNENESFIEDESAKEVKLYQNHPIVELPFALSTTISQPSSNHTSLNSLTPITQRESIHHIPTPIPMNSSAILDSSSNGVQISDSGKSGTGHSMLSSAYMTTDYSSIPINSNSRMPGIEVGCQSQGDKGNSPFATYQNPTQFPSTITQVPSSPSPSQPASNQLTALVSESRPKKVPLFDRTKAFNDWFFPQEHMSQVDPELYERYMEQRNEEKRKGDELKEKERQEEREKRSLK